MRTIDSLIDEQVRKACDEGLFDDLPGHGRPLRDLDRTRSAADVWLENKVHEENLTLPLPEGLRLRKELAAELTDIRGLRDRDEIHARLLQLNARIRSVNSRAVKGPQPNVAPVNIARFLADWSG